MMYHPIALSLVLAAALLAGCQASTPSTARTAEERPVAGGLGSNKVGADFLAASPANQLAYCVSSVKAYKTSGVQSFSVSPSIGNITPESFCSQLNEYFAEEPVRREERLAQAAAVAMLLYSRPKSRKPDAELDQMESRSK
ncbi:hypothetical protein [Gloeobacter violaceus]|uniref:Gll1583 protein n=1 Tax=Gloeobacter violaceus (strain ATCC 29082 / PCC 7421) TaxID=251221 RepID=Q7NK95_GLOVI|nr:hypothetical protein [Gloeobacter violaceus]BAC89524.1 gll1583 [Gloeobacter violaceus PCC 7421]